MPTPSPHLPVDFLRKLQADPMMADLESIIFTSEFHALRLGIVNHLDKRGPDDRGRVQLPAGMSMDNVNVHDAQNTTFAQIHIAAIVADPLHLCEMIRLGADMDLEDSTGHTALLLAMQGLAGYLMFARSGSSFPGASVPGGTTPPIIKRFAFIARTLIEQHVDVNRTGSGMTPLHWACHAQDWDLITLLLKYGAEVSPPGSKLASPDNLLPSSKDKSRFLALARSLPLDERRPAQPCPCWSGKMLADCHAKDQPYPSEFYCVCGSQKSYGKCCSRRNMVVFEKWNEEERYLKQMNVRFTGPTATSDGEGKKDTTQYMIDALHISLPREFLDDNALNDEEAWDFLQWVGVESLSRGLIGFAYAYAMKEVQFLPRPQGRSFSKEACLVAQERWNAAIDKYISSAGLSVERKTEIERETKIGRSNGALYKKCEGVGCNKLEGRDIEKLDCCSTCRMSVYCSRACQASAWKSHKAVCGQASQREQALPCQIAIDAFLLSNGKPVEVKNMPKAPTGIEEYMKTRRLSPSPKT